MNIACYDFEGDPLRTLHQWDVNQIMEVRGVDIDPLPEFHFCNQNSAETLKVVPVVSGTRLIAEIPNILLQEAASITVYIYQGTDNDNDGTTDGARTVHTISIPVIARLMPGDYDYLNSRIADRLDEINGEVI